MFNALVKERMFSFDLRKAIILCKNSFLGGLYKVAVAVGDTPYYHTSFLYRSEGAASGSIATATSGSYSNYTEL